MAKTEQYIERTDGQLILFVPVEGAPDPRNPLDERLMKGFFERKTSLNRVAGAAEFLEQGLAFGTDMREFQYWGAIAHAALIDSLTYPLL